MLHSLLRLFQPVRSAGFRFLSGCAGLSSGGVFRRSRVWAAGAALVVPAGAQQTQNFPLDAKGESMMEMTHVFSSVPPGGYTAVRVVVKNAGKNPINVRLSGTSTTTANRDSHTLGSGGFVFEAKPESTTAREFVVPLMTDFSESHGYYGRSSRLQLSVVAGTASFSTNYEGNKEDECPFVAFSQSVIGKTLDDVNEAMRQKLAAGSGSGSSSSGSYRREGGFAASFVPYQLPSDWRAYTGLDVLVLTPEEWLTLSPGVTTAIRQWVMLGGMLDLVVTGPPPEAILRDLKTDRQDSGVERLGAGGVRLLGLKQADSSPVTSLGDLTLKTSGVCLLNRDGSPAAGTETGGKGGPDFSGIVGKYGASQPGMGIRREVAVGEFRKTAGLADALGIRNFAAWQVGVILLIFGILVGPVNLFYLAAPGRRHRLFFTTPLISLGASAVLIAVIMFQDGSGGSGSRAALIEIRPDDNSAYVRQYQISRTGVLFGSGFVTENPSVITPLMLAPTRWTRLKPSDNDGAEGQHLTVPDPLGYGGDWFQSRSEQAQLVQTIRPGRGRLELKSGGGGNGSSGAPVIVSSLSCRLDRVFYTDAAGKVWTADAALATGGTVSLREAVAEEFQDFLRNETKAFPLHAFDSAGNGKFIAVSGDPQAGFEPTLTSVQWQENHSVIYGPLGAHP